MGCFLLCLVSVFERRTPHPSLTTIEASFVYLLLLIHISSFLIKKMIYLDKCTLSRININQGLITKLASMLKCKATD